MIASLCRYHRKAMPAPRHTPFQDFDPDTRRAITLLAPLLRIADSLDRSHDQRVEGLHVQLRNGTVTLALESPSDTDLEMWAVERVADAFRETYQTVAVLDAGEILSQRRPHSGLCGLRPYESPAHRAGLPGSPRRPAARSNGSSRLARQYSPILARLAAVPGFLSRPRNQKIERRLKRMMLLTSEIRNRDIGLEFLARSKRSGRAPARLERQRTAYQRQFSEMARRWNARDFSARWRTGLSLRSV